MRFDMAIIIDTNCFSRVFCRKNKEHEDFAPVLEWVLHGHGFLVYGGSKYKQELRDCMKFMHFFNMLKTARKAFTFDDDEIDKLQAEYEKMIQHPDFDDPHLPAIVRVSKCRLICSRDFRSVPFVTDPALYPKRFHVPQYYSSKRDAWLLTDDNIDKRLLSYRTQISKQQKEGLYRFVDTVK